MRTAVAEPGPRLVGRAERIRGAGRESVGRARVARGEPQPVRRPELIEMARPAVERPGKIVCVGLNFLHVTEGAGRDVPDRPLLFSKFANAVIGDGDAIVRPEGCHALDLEVELGVVIGKLARRVAAKNAMDHVAGYVVVNDVSARDWQGSPPALREGDASGFGPRAPTRSCRWARSSPQGTSSIRRRLGLRWWRTPPGHHQRSSCRTATRTT